MPNGNKKDFSSLLGSKKPILTEGAGAMSAPVSPKKNPSSKGPSKQLGANKNEDKLNKRVQILLSEKDYQTLRAKAGLVSISVYLRSELEKHGLFD